MTCPVAVSLQFWINRIVEPAAADIMGQSGVSVTHFGTYSCRRIYGGDDGSWSEHATGNAIDISGFVLADGTSISVLNDWDGEGDKAKFLRRVRDESCAIFGTVLSPDYNAAHRDHFHFDQAARNFGVCR